MKRSILAVLAALSFAAAALVLGFLLGGCRRPVPPPPVIVDEGLSACAAGTPAPAPEDACEGLATPAGLQCVKCNVPVACYLEAAGVYCTPQCYDPACSIGGRRAR